MNVIVTYVFAMANNHKTPHILKTLCTISECHHFLTRKTNKNNQVKYLLLATSKPQMVKTRQRPQKVLSGKKTLVKVAVNGTKGFVSSTNLMAAAVSSNGTSILCV
jgi:hypothetical protein